MSESFTSEEERFQKAFAQWGVRGMHWGVRKRKDSGESGKGSAKKVLEKLTEKKDTSESSDSKKARDLSKKKLSEMSNDELRAYTQRLQLEKQYNDLAPKEKVGKVKAGKQFVASLVGTAAKQAAGEYAKKALVVLIDEQLGKKSNTAKFKISK